VADFGIARAVSQAGGEKLTQTGMAIGTPHYMSPEQSLGSEHVDARSDIYSLGCVLYELLTGQPPFTGPNSMAIMARHSMEVVPSLQVVRSSVPDEVEDAVMQALEKTPADRFQTMKEFGERLSEAEAEAAMMRTAQRRASTGFVSSDWATEAWWGSDPMRGKRGRTPRPSERGGVSFLESPSRSKVRNRIRRRCRNDQAVRRLNHLAGLELCLQDETVISSEIYAAKRGRLFERIVPRLGREAMGRHNDILRESARPGNPNDVQLAARHRPGDARIDRNRLAHSLRIDPCSDRRNLSGDVEAADVR
jgi:serine/threonine protein kinase